jgi:hypothetical protein
MSVASIYRLRPRESVRVNTSLDARRWTATLVGAVNEVRRRGRSAAGRRPQRLPDCAVSSWTARVARCQRAALEPAVVPNISASTGARPFGAKASAVTVAPSPCQPLVLTRRLVRDVSGRSAGRDSFGARRRASSEG